jgi:hypothetical protein
VTRDGEHRPENSGWQLMLVAILLIACLPVIQALGPGELRPGRDDAAPPRVTPTPASQVARIINTLPALPSISTVPSTAMVLPTQTLPPVETTEPVATTRAPIATSTVVSIGTPAPRTVLDEPFSDNHRGWPDDLAGAAQFAPAAYHLFAQGNRHVAVSAPLKSSFDDVIVSATFQRHSGRRGGGFGIIVRDQGPLPRNGQDQSGRYYVLAVSDLGYVGIWRRETDHWVALVRWTPSTAVRRGESVNELSVQAIGPRLSLVVNGVETVSAQDAVLGAGGVGVFAIAARRAATQDVAVKHILVQIPAASHPS